MLAFVSGSATAFTGVWRAQLRRLLSSDVQAGLELEASIGSYRSSLVAMRLAAVVATISTATLLAADLSGLRWWAVTGAGVGSALLIAIAEVPARSWAARTPALFMYSFAFPLALVNVLTRPITRLIPLSSEAALARSFAGPLQEVAGPLAEARELRQLAASRDTAELREDERKMIRAILALNTTTVKEIMVPRTDFTAISTGATLPEVVQLLAETARSRVPLYEGTIDNIVGVVYAKDVLNLLNAPPAPFDLRRIAREPYFVPETKKVGDLLREFQAKAIHFALVVDEHGGVEGLVSLNDVMEGIVGEMEAVEEPISLVSDEEALVDGAVSLGEINEALDVNLEGDGFDTIGGYVLHHLGRIPKAGERLETDGIFIEVLATVGRRVKRVRVKKVAHQPEGAQAAS